MAGIRTPGVDVDVSWPLVAGVGVIAALLIWVIYEVVIKSGVQGAAKSAAGLAASAATAAQNVTDAVGGGIATLLGQNNAPGPPVNGTPTPSNTQLFYNGINNFLSTGSLSGE